MIEISEQTHLAYLPYEYYAERFLGEDYYVTFGNNALTNDHNRSVFANDIMGKYLWPRDRIWVLRPEPAVLGRDPAVSTWLEAFNDKDFVLKNTYEYGWNDLLRYEATDRPDFTIPASSAVIEPAANVVFGNRLRLVLYGVGAERIASGRTLDVWLVWEALQNLNHEYVVSIQMRDERGQIAAQTDGNPRHLGKPTQTQFWPVGNQIQGRYSLTVGDDIPPGMYELYVVVYARDGGRRLTVDAVNSPSDSLFLILLQVTAANTGS